MIPTSIPPAAGGIRGRYNHFDAESYFQRDSASGAIFLHGGVRAVSAPPALLRHLGQALTSSLGPDAAPVLYKCGFEWGLRDMQRCHADLREGYGQGTLDPRQMHRRFVFVSWWFPLAAQGWGTARITHTSAAGLAWIEVRDAAVDHGVLPPSSLLAGLFAGAVSFLDCTARHATEFPDAVPGQSAFLTGPEAAVREANARFNDGSAAEEIRALLFPT